MRKSLVVSVDKLKTLIGDDKLGIYIRIVVPNASVLDTHLSEEHAFMVLLYDLLLTVGVKEQSALLVVRCFYAELAKTGETVVSLLSFRDGRWCSIHQKFASEGRGCSARMIDLKSGEPVELDGAKPLVSVTVDCLKLLRDVLLPVAERSVEAG
jgi:hypothetical protein